MSSFVYDISEVEDVSSFIYDVKVLYQLKGYRVKSFLDLCHTSFGHPEIATYHQACQRIKAHIRSYMDCQIQWEDYKANEILPSSLIETLTCEKQALIDRLFQRFHDEDVMRFYEANFFQKLQCLHRISKNLGLKFNYVGSKTGRLSFKNHTFNPYSLPKDQRSQIKARPGYSIYEFDLKSSQPRIAIFSTDNKEFKERFAQADDIYSIFPGDRHSNKLSFLRWMYSSNYASDEKFGTVASPIKNLRSVIFDDSIRFHGVIHNRFGRPLFFHGEPENIVFQNFISSTEADALYEIVCSMQALLADKQSRILFPFYDAVVCEIHEDEKDLADKLKHCIEEHYLDHVFYCRFPVEVKSGKDFGALRAA